MMDRRLVGSSPPVNIVVNNRGKTVDSLPCHMTMETGGGRCDSDGPSPSTAWIGRAKRAIVTFGKFVGPGFMVAVAYS